MKRNTIVLLIVFAVIVGSIYYLDSARVRPQISYGDIETVKIGPGGNVTPEESARISKKEMMYSPAPELVGIVGYINAKENLKISDFNGKVVLIDFWTYSCINCLRTLPYLTDWDRKYKDKGLVIIGVHTPEFEFEKVKENVIASMQKHGVEYRVVQDNDYVTWSAYNNRFWPRKYLIDADGFIRYDHIGEGAYLQTEREFRKLLEEAGYDVSDINYTDIDDETPTVLVMTPELYAGYKFALPRLQDLGNSPGLTPEAITEYKLPSSLNNNRIYLVGFWESKSELLQAKGEDVSVVLSFNAKTANIVAGTADETFELDVFIDDSYVSEEFAGSDVNFDGERAYVVVENPRLYNVFSGKRGRYVLKLVSKSSDFYFNAFTFG